MNSFNIKLLFIGLFVVLFTLISAQEFDRELLRFKAVKYSTKIRTEKYQNNNWGPFRYSHAHLIFDSENSEISIIDRVKETFFIYDIEQTMDLPRPQGGKSTVMHALDLKGKEVILVIHTDEDYELEYEGVKFPYLQLYVHYEFKSVVYNIVPY
jgi:hypothetical protein